MKHSLFIMIFLLSSTLLQASPFGFECPCKHKPKPPQPTSQFSQVWFDCGCGGDEGDTGEIPPYQD